MNKKSNKSGLRKQILLITNGSILVLGLVILVFSYFQFSRTMEYEVERNLQSVAKTALLAFENQMPGDMEIVEDESGNFVVRKGGKDVNEFESFIDEIKSDTGIDITFFYLDVRVLTTICDDSGYRIIGSVANKAVTNDVFGKKGESFYNNMTIGDEVFFSFYSPIVNSKGEKIGMVFTGKPAGSVRKEVLVSALPIIGIDLVMMLLVGAIVTSFAGKLVEAIALEKNFLNEIANGNLRADLDVRVVSRNDELGEMARYSVHVLKFIRDMIERDTLTKLYTRRIGEPKIRNSQNKALEYHMPYCVAMCDIDHFKRFNDTYGHDCGDLVLRETASVFNRELVGDGYAVRWGGEEIIVFYEDMGIEKALEKLKNLREKILANYFTYNDEKLSITMTFGLVEGDNRDINDIVKVADELLYYGKEHGRNQIVTVSMVEDAKKEALEAAEKEEVKKVAPKRRQTSKKASETETKAAKKTQTRKATKKPVEKTDKSEENI